MLIGTILAVDLRLLGLGVRRQTASQIAGELAPWTLGGLVLAIVTGVLLFSYDPLKFYANHAFSYKVALLAAAVAFHYTAHRKVTREGTAHVNVWGTACGWRFASVMAGCCIGWTRDLA